MAVTLTKRQTDKARELIKTERICEVLQEHVDGKRELKPSQVRAAEILLNRTIPCLMAQSFSIEDAQAVIPILKIVPHESDKAA